MQTTHIIEVTQGITGPIIDRFTIDLDDDLDDDEKYRLMQEEAYRRLNEKQQK